MDQKFKILLIFVIVVSVQTQSFVEVPGRSSWPYNYSPYSCCGSTVTQHPCVNPVPCLKSQTIIQLPRQRECPKCETKSNPVIEDPKSKCKDTFVLDATSGRCVCPAETPYHDDFLDMCVECVGGMVWNELTNKCVCPSEGAPWNPTLMECSCPGESYWDRVSRTCKCSGVRIFNGQTEQCICEGDLVYDRTLDQCTCGKGRVPNFKNECVCPKDKPKTDYFTGECVACEFGKYWNDRIEECICMGDQEWNPLTRTCQCPGERIFDPIMKSCICGSATSWKYTCESSTVCESTTEIFPNCDPPYKLSHDNKCYIEEDSVCEDGTKSTGDYCIYIKVNNIVCPQGYSYNSLSRLCVSTVDPICGPGQNFKQGQCIEEIVTTPKCSYGYKMIHGKCVLFKDSQCPVGYEHHFDKCVKKTTCKDGQKLVNGVCVKEECPKGYYKKCGVCELPVSLDCPNGFYFDGTVCRRKVINCPRGFILERDICVRKTRSECPTGFILVGYECHRKVIGSCPSGYHLIHGVCKRIMISSCPPGFELVGDDMCVKKSATVIKCATDEEEVGDTCRKKPKPCGPGECTTITSRCEPGQLEVEGKCYAISTPPCIGPSCTTECSGSKCSSGGNSQTTNIYNNVHPPMYPISNVNNVNVYGGGGESGCTYKCKTNEKYRNNCEYVC